MAGSKHEAEFRRFATATSPALFRAAWLLTGDWHAAEDLVQDALTIMFRAWPGIERIDNPVAYAHTVLTRRFLSQRRRRSSTERPTAALPDQPDADADADLRVSLVRALAQLPARDRAVLVLRYLADRSVEQVAGDLGRSPSAIKVQSMRALAKLREVLGADLAELIQN
jgi:RNA polymerase sigma-70 factor (sigma-E family)